MTLTASASPIALLISAPSTATTPAASTVVDPAATGNTAANADADGDNPLLAALNGGFQLLIDAAAQQQNAAPLPLKTATKTASTTNANGTDGGNVLPLLGALLPTATDPVSVQATTDGTIGQGATDKADADEKNAAEAADNAAVQLLWVPVNVQTPAPAPNANAAANNTAAGDNVDTGIGGVTLLAASNQQASADTNALPIPGEETADVQSSGLPANKQAGGERNFGTRADVLTTSSNNATKLDVAPQDLIGAAQKPADITSFADLLKAPASTAAANPLAAPLDGARSQQAARPYVEMNSTGATVTVPVGSSGWSDAVVDKVMWFSANKFSSAEIQLNPPDLGPLQVRISTQHDQASVVFSSPHAAVRDALDQALPRLRDMLGGQGIQLSDASVGGHNAQSQQQAQQQQNGGRTAAPSFFQSDDSSIAPTAVTRVQVPRLSTSAVDAYA